MTERAEAAHLTARPRTAPRTRTSIFSALRYRNYQLYWTGMILAVAAMNMEFVALSWLVLQITNAPVAIGITGMVNAAPIICLNLLGGAIADRVDRKRLIAAVQAIAAILYFVLATLVTIGLVQFWHVLLFAFLIGTARAFDGPARMALLPHMVPREEIPSAVALSNVVWQLPRMIGPAVSGLLIAVVGVGASLYVSGLFAFCALCLFSGLHFARQSEAPGGTLVKNIVEGLTYIRDTPTVLSLIAMTFFNSIFGMSFVLMEAVFARDVLRVGSEGFGFMEAAGGIGALAGVAIAAYLAKAGHKGLQIIAGAVVFGSALVGFAISPWFGVSLALLFVCGMFSQIYMTIIITTLQLDVPDTVRGRVIGLFTMTYSLMPLGGTIAGGIAQLAGAPTAVALGGALVTGMAITVAARVPQVRDLD